MVAQVPPPLPPPLPQAIPVFDIVPADENWAQPVTPPSDGKVGIPFTSILKAETDEVAKVEGEDVAR